MPTELHLPNTITAPPGLWRYRMPETGQTFGPHPSLDALTTEVRASYTANGYTIPTDLNALIESYLCSVTPNYCVPDGVPALSLVASFWKGLSNTFHTVLQGTKTIGTWLVRGQTFVSQEQANTRAAICSTCPLNDTPQGCTACNMNSLTNMVESLVGKRTTTSHDKLKSCVNCLCLLKVKVWLPHDIIWSHLTPDQKAALPAHCWHLTEQSTTPTP